MAGTVTVSENLTGSVKKITWAWTSDASGNADKITDSVLDGEVLQLETVPSGGGTQPTDLYDITITDENSVDVLSGAGANRSNASNQSVWPVTAVGAYAPSGVRGKLTLNVSNAGNTKSGTAILFVR